MFSGAINLHPSLLPKWRGPSPLVHTLLNGEQETGVSIIEVSTKKYDEKLKGFLKGFPER